MVTDDVLTRAVSELRKVFEDDPRRGRIIETIPKVGYRLVAPISLAERGDSVPTLLDVPSVSPSLPLPASRPASAPAWVWPLLAAAVVMGGFLGWYATRPVPSAPVPLRAQPLTTLPGREFSAALSPDGDRVAFVRSSDDEGGTDIYVSPVASLQPLRLTDDPGFEWRPAWSPDGSTIAFVRRASDACGVYAVPALGGPERRLVDCEAGGYPDLAWSPEPSGRWLALSDRAAGEPGTTIHLVDLQDGSRRVLTSLDDGQLMDYTPRFSPDGERLAFVRSYGENMQALCVVYLPDGQPGCLRMAQQGISGFDWTPDGAHLVFASNRGGAFSLWKVPADGGDPVWMAVGEESLRPSIARTARRLVYEHWTNDTNIYSVSPGATGTPPAPVAASTRMDFFPHFSPDGRKIAFVSDRTGHYEVWMSDADGAHAWQLTSGAYTYALLPRWSPDGGRIAYAAFSEGRSVVFVIDAPGAPPRRLTDGTTDAVYPGWSADGRWIYFGSEQGGTWQVWKMPAGGGRAVQVTTQGGFVAQESPDGATLYYTRRGEDGLRQMPTAGGPERPAFDALRSFDASNWSLTEDGVYFIDRRAMPDVSVSFYDFGTGRVSEAVALGRTMTEGGFAVSPDGRQILYIQVDQADADLMLVEGI